jgi:hypothetical protein
MWAFITSKLGLGCIALALVLGVIGVQTVRLHMAQHALQTAQDGWSSCKATVATQNAAIAAQSARSTAALEAASKAQAAVAPIAAHYALKAAGLSVYKPKGSDRCAMIEDAVDEARRSFQ